MKIRMFVTLYCNTFQISQSSIWGGCNVNARLLIAACLCKRERRLWWHNAFSLLFLISDRSDIIFFWKRWRGSVFVAYILTFRCILLFENRHCYDKKDTKRNCENRGKLCWRFFIAFSCLLRCLRIQPVFSAAGNTIIIAVMYSVEVQMGYSSFFFEYFKFLGLTDTYKQLPIMKFKNLN